MNARFRRFGWLFAVASFTGLTTLPANAQGKQSHVVSEQELAHDTQQSSDSRLANEAAIHRILSSQPGQQALESVHVDYQKIDKAVGQLSDQDLAKLAERSRQTEKDFAAGLISAKHFAELILVLVVVIVIIVLV
jgi:hypothetical protein